MTDRDLAVEANRQAAIALARMDMHVIECSGRYEEVKESLASVREAIVRLHERIDVTSEKREKQMAELRDRMDENFAKRAEQFKVVKQDNKINHRTWLVAVLGWALAAVMLVVQRFWK